MSYNYLPLDERWLGFDQVRWLLEYRQRISITFGAHEQIVRCREYLDNLEGGKLYYGINTGFGFLQNVRIDPGQTEQLQYNLLKSHACGLGEVVPEEIVRLMLVFKIKSLSYGHSGVQIDTVKRLLDFYNQDVLPVVYTQGSLGASGDLAPLSHLCLPLIGLGEVTVNGERKNAKELAWEPIKLRSKEGLALINGTQFMTAYGLYILTKAKRLLDWADKVAALSWDAFDCSLEPLHPKIHEIRPHKGQVETAKTIKAYLGGSELAEAKKSKVQVPAPDLREPE